MLADTWTKDVKLPAPDFRELRILLKFSVEFANLAYIKSSQFHRESPTPIPCTLGITASPPPAPWKVCQC